VCTARTGGARAPHRAPAPCACAVRLRLRHAPCAMRLRLRLRVRHAPCARVYRRAQAELKTCSLRSRQRRAEHRRSKRLEWGDSARAVSQRTRIGAGDSLSIADGAWRIAQAQAHARSESGHPLHIGGGSRLSTESSRRSRCASSGIDSDTVRSDSDTIRSVSHAVRCLCATVGCVSEARPSECGSIGTDSRERVRYRERADLRGPGAMHRQERGPRGRVSSRPPRPVTKFETRDLGRAR
jgi:hypothetical protein